MCGYTSYGVHMEVRRTFVGVGSLYHVSFKDQTLVLRLGSKSDLMSYFTLHFEYNQI